MHRIDTTNAVALLPTPAAPGTPGFFSKGNPGPGTPSDPTSFDQDWCNAMQEEIVAVVVAAGLSLDKTNNAQLLAALTTLIGAKRSKLVANTTFYVGIAGSDITGTGTSGNPWRTAQHAWDTLVSGYDLNGFQATILRQDSTAYTDNVVCSGRIPGQTGPVIFSASSSANVTVTCSSSQNYIADLGALIAVQNQKLVNSTGGMLYATRTSIITHGGCNFGTCPGSQIVADRASTIQQTGTVTISGNCSTHATVSSGAEVDVGSATLTGTPAFAGAFVSASQCGVITSSAAVYTGAATGARYAATLNAVISSGGGGANYFPGNSVGTTATGGQYA